MLSEFESGLESGDRLPLAELDAVAIEADRLGCKLNRVLQHRFWNA
ncbi:MAG: hypothetical protein HC770_07725 [Pseudanabaena sp. CRU_2_10]|nr:hypothetical protein [Pseudanabaena sp. CRU_2_10]